MNTPTDMEASKDETKQEIRQFTSQKSVARSVNEKKVRGGVMTASLESTIRTRIVHARNLNRLDQKNAAARLGYRNSSPLCKIESGFARVPKDFIIKAAVAYGVSTDYLLGLSDEPERDPKTAEHMAIMRAVEATIRQQNHSLVGILLKNASDMTPMEGHLVTLLASARRCVEAFEAVCRRNSHFQNDIRGGATLQNAMDDVQVAANNAKKFCEHRSDLIFARTEAMCDGISYPLFEASDLEWGETL